MTSPASENASRTRRAVLALLAAGSIGSFLGLLIGLSDTPVVASVIAALLALLAGLLGFQNPPQNPSEHSLSPAPNSLTVDRRLGVLGFGVASIIGVLGGVYLRVQNVFAITPTQRVTSWVAAGYDPDSARRIIESQTLGNQLPGGVGKANMGDPEENTALRKALTKYCEQVKPDRFGQIESLETAFDQPGPLNRIVPDAKSIQDTVLRRDLLTTVYHLYCDHGQVSSE